MAEGAVTARSDQSKKLCEWWMPRAKEPCARSEGHHDQHSTRYAMDNLRDARHVQRRGRDW